MSYERDNVKRMAGYIPGEQPADRSVVKLNTNENPYPPSDGVLEALQSITADALRRYPNPTASAFRQLAADVHGVAPENIVATNAGDEVLRLAISTFVEPGRPIGTTEPSYSLYPVLAEAHGSPTVRIALNDDWSIPDDLPAKLNAAKVPLTFLVNPHAPSGRLTDAARLSAIAKELDGVLLIDEAYVNFVDPPLSYDATRLIREHDNVLILRTLSKGYSLAGLRFGYAIGAASLIEPMQTKTKDSYNTDAVAQRLAEAALRHRDEAALTWKAVRSERERVTQSLSAAGLSVAPSQTNFVLVTVPGVSGGEAKNIYESLKARKIFIRYFDQDRLRDKLRITIGTPDENTALLNALKEIL